jgi:hypothetical protein
MVSVALHNTYVFVINEQYQVYNIAFTEKLAENETCRTLATVQFKIFLSLSHLLCKNMKIKTQNYNFTCFCTGVKLSQIKGNTQIEGVWEQGVEENI